jgi:hypothetical protein
MRNTSSRLGVSEDLVDYKSGRLRLGGVNLDRQLHPGLLTLLQQRCIEIGRGKEGPDDVKRCLSQRHGRNVLKRQAS